MLNRETFFARARASLFGNVLLQGQVDGLGAILDQWHARKGEGGDLRWLAYMLATTLHETARTMQPIEEYGRGHGLPYGAPDPASGLVYYGRGYVQLTWRRNYEVLGRLLDVDLLGHPDRALEPAVAADIMFAGMERGLFTGVGLPRYFNEQTDDPVNARRIINGTDKAPTIAGYHEAFLAALR